MKKIFLFIVVSLLAGLILIGGGCNGEEQGDLELRVEKAMKAMIEEFGWSMDLYTFIPQGVEKDEKKVWDARQIDNDRYKRFVRVSLKKDIATAQAEIQKGCDEFLESSQYPHYSYQRFDIGGATGCGYLLTFTDGSGSTSGIHIHINDLVIVSYDVNPAVGYIAEKYAESFMRHFNE